jgi:hypothetical protein
VQHAAMHAHPHQPQSAMSPQDQQQMYEQQQQYYAYHQQQHDLAQTGQQQQQQGDAPPAELSSLQYAQLQQLQFQAMQWQYLQQLQQQQLYLQQQQQQGQFDPNAGGAQAAGGAQQYRSAYQSYGAYPTTQQQQPTTDPSQQQLVALDANGQSVQPASDQVQTNADGTVSSPGRSRYHNDQHAPSVDPNAWNGSVAYPSKSNPDRYIAHRNYFSKIPPVIKSVRHLHTHIRAT